MLVLSNFSSISQWTKSPGLQILLKELQADAYSDGLRDQNAVIYLLKTHPEWHDRVAFLDKEVCLNCYWRDLIGVTGFGKPDYDRKENVSRPSYSKYAIHKSDNSWVIDMLCVSLNVNGAAQIAYLRASPR